MVRTGYLWLLANVLSQLSRVAIITGHGQAFCAGADLKACMICLADCARTERC